MSNSEVVIATVTLFVQSDSERPSAKALASRAKEERLNDATSRPLFVQSGCLVERWDCRSRGNASLSEIRPRSVRSRTLRPAPDRGCRAPVGGCASFPCVPRNAGLLVLIVALAKTTAVMRSASAAIGSFRASPITIDNGRALRGSVPSQLFARVVTVGDDER